MNRFPFQIQSDSFFPAAEHTEGFIRIIRNIEPLKQGASFPLDIRKNGQFFGWLPGLGAGACLAAPADIVEQYRQYLQAVMKRT